MEVLENKTLCSWMSCFSIGAMLRLAQLTFPMLEVIGQPRVFELGVQLLAHLEIEYGRFRRYQMQHIEELCQDQENVLHTMYTWLAWLAQLPIKVSNIFIECLLVKIFFSKIKKQIIELIGLHLPIKWKKKMAKPKTKTTKDAHNTKNNDKKLVTCFVCGKSDHSHKTLLCCPPIEAANLFINK